MGVRGQESQKKVTSCMDGPLKNRPRQLIILQHNILDLEKKTFCIEVYIDWYVQLLWERFSSDSWGVSCSGSFQV